MLSLADRLTVPQFFFNEKHIGGADDLIKFVDEVEKGGEYDTFYDYYNQKIKKLPDPKDKRLQVPTSPPVVEKPPPPRSNEKSVKLPNGTMTSVLDITLQLREILPAENLRYKMTIYRKSFTGIKAVQLFKKHFNLPTDEDAVKFGNVLIDHKILKHVVGDHKFKNEGLYYRLQCYDEPAVLNSFRVWNERVDSDSMALLKRLKRLLGKVGSAVTDGDGLVDYQNAHKNKNYPIFEEAVCELQGVDMGKMGRDTRLAFGINLYNLMIKYAFMKVGIGTTSYSRGAFFSIVKFNVGGNLFSFQDLENGILRGNKRPVLGLKPQLSSNDPRSHLVLTEPDNRIHFALNCGAKSCPPVKNFSATAIDEELRIVAQAFAEQEENVKIFEETNTISLNKILSWYRSDFARSNNELPEKVLPFLRGGKKAKLHEMIKSGQPIKVKFNVYDWGTNASNFVPFESSALKANVSALA